MKRFIALFLLLCLAFTSVPAFAASEYIGNMEVVNCNEWVSLRETPSTSAKRLVKVSLGAIVRNCMQFNDKWIYAEYDGYSGYILAEYLEPCDGRLTFNAMMITITGEGAPFYPMLDSEEAIDYIPANTIVRNCRIMDNGRICVEWGGRWGFISLLHAEVYNEMLHFPRQMTLHYSYNTFSEEYESPALDLKIAYAEDFDLSAYEYAEFDYTEFDYTESGPADEDVPKVRFVLYADSPVKQVHLFSVSIQCIDDETGEEVIDAILENIQYEMAPEHPLAVTAVMYGDMPNLAVGYEDETGAYHFAFIEISGEDGSIYLNEF